MPTARTPKLPADESALALVRHFCVTRQLLPGSVISLSGGFALGFVIAMSVGLNVYISPRYIWLATVGSMPLALHSFPPIGPVRGLPFTVIGKPSCHTYVRAAGLPEVGSTARGTAVPL